MIFHTLGSLWKPSFVGDQVVRRSKTTTILYLEHQKSFLNDLIMISNHLEHLLGKQTMQIDADKKSSTIFLIFLRKWRNPKGMKKPLRSDNDNYVQARTL